jgi:hypothetical protein
MLRFLKLLADNRIQMDVFRREGHSFNRSGFIFLFRKKKNYYCEVFVSDSEFCTRWFDTIVELFLEPAIRKLNELVP